MHALQNAWISSRLSTALLWHVSAQRFRLEVLIMSEIGSHQVKNKIISEPSILSDGQSIPSQKEIKKFQIVFDKHGDTVT